MSFQFQQLKIPGIILITPTRYEDHRGWFQESYKISEFFKQGLPLFVQDNVAYSRQNVLRGLHYQSYPHAQGKLVMVLSGEIFDVAIDIRKSEPGKLFQDSPMYGQWVGEYLSVDNGRMLYVPPGFAHGYYVTSIKAVVLYKVTTEYNPDAERGIRWNDPEIGITWPTSHPILSEKDRSLPFLREK